MTRIQSRGFTLIELIITVFIISILVGLAIPLARNSIKRAAFGNLWRFVAHGCSTQWPTLARSLLRQALTSGGVFHLWGHSWELQETGQWQRLSAAISRVVKLKEV